MGNDYLASCMLCPRGCGADRRGGRKGFCRETEQIRIARAALHFWEEPCISGEEGSGTVFFTGCNLRCVYCQNYTLSRSEAGKAVSPARLAQIFLSLQEQGANNLNLVTPTHFVPQIISALDQAKEQGFHLPVVYNSSGYEKIETLQRLEGYVDVYLPDFKYWERETAGRYSFAEDYPEVAKPAIAEMVRQMKARSSNTVAVAGNTGQARQSGGDAPLAAFDDRSIIRRGVIVRHLLLPGHVKEAKQIVRYLHETYGNAIYLSLLRQYTPLDTLDCARFPELARRVTKREYESLVDYAIGIGVENGFIQEGESAKESFIPDFTNGIE